MALLICLILFVGYAWSGAEKEVGKEGPKTIGFSMVGVGMNAYLTTWVDTFNAEAEKRGYKMIMADANFDASMQASQIENLLEQNIDGLVLWPADVHALVPSFRKAKESGILVISSITQLAPEGFHYVDAVTGLQNYGEGEEPEFFNYLTNIILDKKNLESFLPGERYGDALVKLGRLRESE